MSEVVLLHFPEFEAKIHAMTDAVKGEMLMEAALAGARDIETQAKINVPKRSGNLSRSIHVEPGASTANSAVATVGTNVVYAAMIEYGYHGPEAVKAHFRTIKEAFGRRLKFPVTAHVNAFVRQINRAAQPYMRPALDTTRAQVVATIRGTLLDTLRRFTA